MTLTIGIVGLGLIGGSMGLDWRDRGHRVLGVSRRPETIERAIERGACDQASCELDLLQSADVVVLCTPLGVMTATIDHLLPHLADSAILTDAGSVKAPIVAAIAPRYPNFVGGHPMAGTADSGIEAALRGLFVDRPYVLTPTATTPPAAIETVAQLARDLSARVYQTSPDRHDRAVAWISHLPVVVSASLINACLADADPELVAIAQSLASSGFADTSRVGGGNPELGLMMAQYNRDELLRSLRGYRAALDAAIDEIDRQDWTALGDRYTASQQARPKFL